MRNYLALLGWGPGEGKTIMSTEEMVEHFTLERVSASPAQLNMDKLALDERHLHPRYHPRS